MARKKTPPKYCLHKASGRAFVKINGRQYMLGAHGTPESRARYHATLAAWEETGRLPGDDAADEKPTYTVAGLARDFLAHLDCTRRAEWLANNRERVRLGLAPLLEEFGDLAPSALTPVLFAAVRTKLLQSGKLNIRSINTKLSYIRRMIDWGASMELVPITVRDACSTMQNVHQDEAGARPASEGEAVPEDVVRATLPYLSRQAAALVELLLLTGARPSELVGVRSCDIDQSGEPWALRLQHHKTARKGKRREVYFGPEAREVLNRFLRRVPAPPADRPLFSPAAAETERRLEVARGRRTPRWASHMRRNAEKRVAAPKIAPGDAYTTGSLNRAIQRAVARANRDRAAEGKPQLPRWHVYQLRHTAATNLAKLFGIEAVRTVLGHSSVTMTEVYVERDLELSRKITEQAG